MKNYKARLYDKDAGHGKQVTISIIDSKLIVENNSTPQEIDLSNLEFKLGGFSEDRIIMVNKLTGESIVTKEHAILEDLTRANIPIHVLQQAKTVKFGIKTKPGQRMASWGFAAAGLFLLALLAYVILDPVTFYIASHMPSSIEKEMGKEVLERYAQSHQLENTSSKARRVQKLGNKLVENLKLRNYDFNFYVEPSKEVNAFATPGGNIVVLTELIRKANDDELACILAHEIGHVVQRHSLKSALRNAGLFVTLQVLTARSSQAAADVLGGLIQVEGLRFDREQEKEADLTGVKLAWESGFSPAALVDFMHKLEKESSENNTSLSILSDHPMPSERADYIETEIASLQQQASSPGGVPAKTESSSTPDEDEEAHIVHDSPPTGVLINLARMANDNYKKKQFDKASQTYSKLLKETELNPDPELVVILDSLQNYYEIEKQSESKSELKELHTQIENISGKVYTSYIRKTFQDTWKPPSTKNKESAEVFFQVQPNGAITGLKLSKPSGINSYNQAALKTVKQSSPLKSPPKILQPPIAIQFTFDQNVHR